MRLNVTNEVGKLKSVLVHLPGREIDVMIPSMMEELLFDDILYGQAAREEHRRFQQIIYFVAEQVYDIQDLLEETLEEPDIRKEILQDFGSRFPLRGERCADGHCALSSRARRRRRECARQCQFSFDRRRSAFVSGSS